MNDNSNLPALGELDKMQVAADSESGSSIQKMLKFKGGEYFINKPSKECEARLSKRVVEIGRPRSGQETYQNAFFPQMAKIVRPMIARSCLSDQLEM